MATADLLTEPQEPAAPSAEPAAPEPPRDEAAALGADDAKTWLATLPEDIRQSPSLARYSSPESLARAYLNAERMIGSEKVPIPKDDADQEAWDRYYKAGGRPDEPTQYEFPRPKPEELPEGVTYDEDMEQWYRQTALDHGLSKRQAKGFFEAFRDRVFAQQDAAHKVEEQQVTRAKVELQRDWGTEYEARRQLAKAAFAEMPPELQEMAKASGMVRSAALVRYLYKIKAETTGELDASSGQQPAVDTPQALKDRIAEFRGQHAKALQDAHHPEHAMRVRELSALFERLFPPEEK